MRTRTFFFFYMIVLFCGLHEQKCIITKYGIVSCVASHIIFLLNTHLYLLILDKKEEVILP